MKSIAEIFHSHEVLDEQGRHVNGTDKHGPNHQYGDVYESLFPEWNSQEYLKNCCPSTPSGRKYCPQCESDTSHRIGCSYHYQVRSSRESVELMMEIGITDGSSLLAWRDIFPNATCVGLDIHDAARLREHRYERTEFHLGDMTKLEDCERAASGRQFDFICEDATHKLGDSLCTLLYLWPYVKRGGLYVIEEFASINVLHKNIAALWPCAEVVGTVEPLVVFRKP